MSMSANFTPGPWTLNKWSDVVDSTGETIRVQGVALTGSPVAKANARLLAAAPQLLEALRWFVMFQRTHGEDSNDSFERVADAFHRDTGYLRPGKDCRIHSPEVRLARWDEWMQNHIDQARAAISAAEGSGK